MVVYGCRFLGGFFHQVCFFSSFFFVGHFYPSPVLNTTRQSKKNMRGESSCWEGSKKNVTHGKVAVSVQVSGGVYLSSGFFLIGGAYFSVVFRNRIFVLCLYMYASDDNSTFWTHFTFFFVVPEQMHPFFMGVCFLSF